MLKEHSDDRIKTLQDTISFLEDKIGMRADEIASKSELRSAEKRANHRQKIVEFYEKLTSTTVVYLKDKRAFTCMTTNPETKKGVQFSVRRTSDGDNKFKAMANKKFLPEFLRSEQGAVFDDTQFPFLLKEIYNADMFKESDA